LHDTTQHTQFQENQLAGEMKRLINTPTLLLVLLFLSIRYPFSTADYKNKDQYRSAKTLVHSSSSSSKIGLPNKRLQRLPAPPMSLQQAWSNSNAQPNVSSCIAKYEQQYQQHQQQQQQQQQQQHTITMPEHDLLTSKMARLEVLSFIARMSQRGYAFSIEKKESKGDEANERLVGRFEKASGGIGVGEGSDKNVVYKSIPLVLHQMWKDEKIHSHSNMAPRLQKQLDLYASDFLRVLWTDEELVLFISRFYSTSVQRFFMSALNMKIKQVSGGKKTYEHTLAHTSLHMHTHTRTSTHRRTLLDTYCCTLLAACIWTSILKLNFPLLLFFDPSHLHH